jgi:hypothetical protein
MMIKTLLKGNYVDYVPLEYQKAKERHDAI